MGVVRAEGPAAQQVRSHMGPGACVPSFVGAARQGRRKLRQEFVSSALLLVLRYDQHLLLLQSCCWVCERHELFPVILVSPRGDKKGRDLLPGNAPATYLVVNTPGCLFTCAKSQRPV